MNKYPFRVKQSRFAEGVAMLISMGVLTEVEGKVYATDGGCWRELGPIYNVPTGTLDADGNEIKGPVCDATGEPYHHANLDTPHDLAETAAQFSDVPEIAAALADFAGWFVTDENGRPRLPNNPVEVMFEV